MPLMPTDVANVGFRKPPIGKRGYDENEVDAFLHLVEAELARLVVITKCTPPRCWAWPRRWLHG